MNTIGWISVQRVIFSNLNFVFIHQFLSQFDFLFVASYHSNARKEKKDEDKEHHVEGDCDKKGICGNVH